MKKIISILIVVFLFTSLPIVNPVIAANVAPTVAIYPPSSSAVRQGGSISYRVVAKNATSFNISRSDIGIARGISADISIQDVNANEKIIVLNNIQGEVGADGYIAIRAGVAKNGSVGSATTPASAAFTLLQKEQPQQPQQPQKPQEPQQPVQPQQPVTPPTQEPSNNGNTTPEETNNKENNNQKPSENPEKKDTESPTLNITKASPSSIYIDGEVSYTLEYSDNIGIESITLSEKDITLYGFTANIKISGSGNTRTVTLSKIQGDLGGVKYIKIVAATASDKAGNKIKNATRSDYFKIVNDKTKNKPDDWIENPNTGR